MKTILIIIAAFAMTACTSTQSVYAPEQLSAVGIDAGDAITLEMTDGRTIKAKFVAIEDGDIVYDDRAGERHRAEAGDVHSLNYRAYDSEKTGEVMAGTAKVTGAILVGFAHFIGAMAQGMSY